MLIDTIYVVIIFSIKDKSHESIRTYVLASLHGQVNFSSLSNIFLKNHLRKPFTIECNNIEPW